MFNSLSAFYTSNTWADFRRSYVAEHGTTCDYCHTEIVKPYDLILHHIEELTESNVNDYDISLNPNNIMKVHHRCHNKIHERFGAYTRHIYLVYGAPGSGKTSFIKDSAGRRDLIVDMDSIFEMISINDRYDKPDTLASCAFGVRDCLLDMIRVRRGKWHNAYIIGGYPRVGERERICQIYGAEEIFIPCDQEECLIRVADRPGWDEFVNRWFDEYTPPHLK